MTTKSEPYVRTLGIERRYARELRSVAREVGRIISGYPDPIENPTVVPQVSDALSRYADILTPWAKVVGGRMVSEVERINSTMWRQHAAEMSRALRLELMTAPTGAMTKLMLAEQVELIRSLPLDAAKRVHEMTLKGLENSERASSYVAEIMRSGEVTKSRATLIARTETSRTASNLTMARAVHVGSEAYVWRTSRDSDVRESHRKMEGKAVRWGDPPTLDKLRGHAGCLPNCRCYPEPIIPDL